MKKLYLPGDVLTLVALRLSAVSQLTGNIKTIPIPDNTLIEQTPFETHFPYTEYPYVKTVITVHHVCVASSTVRLNGDTQAIIATINMPSEHYTINEVGHVVTINDSGMAIPGYFVRTLPDFNKDNPIDGHVWIGENQCHYLDMDCARLIVSKNQRWEEDATLRIDQDFFNVLRNFIMFKDKEEESLSPHAPIPKTTAAKPLDFFDVRDNITNNGVNSANLLISQITLPRGIDTTSFMQRFKEELLDSFPMKKYLTAKELAFYHESVVSASTDIDGNVRVHTDIRLAIFTTLYQRLQSRIIGSRSVGTLEEKVMQALAGVMEDIGLSSEESKLYLHLNRGRHFIVNRATVKSLDVFRHVVLPVNDAHNWRVKLESFIKYANFKHKVKPVNLHAVRFKLAASASLIPEMALLRFRAEMEYDINSDVLFVQDGETFLVFTTTPCVKARLKSPGGLMEISVLRTEQIKTLFANKVNIHHTVEDAFTVFNLYSDVDIENVYQEILNRGTIDEFVKPLLTLC